MVSILEALKNFKIVHTLLTFLIVIIFAGASLTGNQFAAENFKEITLIAVTFWFNSDSVERAIKATASNIGVQKQ